MDIMEVNQVLSKIKEKLESLHPAKLAEGSAPSRHDSAKLAGAKKRLDNLYGKLTKGRSDATKVKATGAKR